MSGQLLAHPHKRHNTAFRCQDKKPIPGAAHPATSQGHQQDPSSTPMLATCIKGKGMGGNATILFMEVRADENLLTPSSNSQLHQTQFCALDTNYRARGAPNCESPVSGVKLRELKRAGHWDASTRGTSETPHKASVCTRWAPSYALSPNS